MSPSFPLPPDHPHPHDTPRRRHQRHQRILRERAELFFRKNILLLLLLGGMVLITGLYKDRIRYYWAAFTQKKQHKHLSNDAREAARISRIMEQNIDKTFGFDISHYQERQAIDWDSLTVGRGSIPLEFVVMRATMGNRKADRNFDHFWKKAKEKNLIRGAYHFYRPDEDPVMQANSYLSKVKLESGDLVPVLDLEKFPRKKSSQQYINDIKVWMRIVEEAYGVRPILYTYYYYYRDYLAVDFAGYPLWLANYNPVEQPSPDHPWILWQFTENGISRGIDVKVDLNIFNGSRRELLDYTIP